MQLARERSTFPRSMTTPGAAAQAALNGWVGFGGFVALYLVLVLPIVPQPRAEGGGREHLGCFARANKGA